MDRKICVYCSSSKKVPEIYFQAAKDLGKMIGENGDSLVFGGTKVGLMEAVADEVKKNGGKVIGVVPETLHLQNIGYQAADELIRTKDMYDRKAIMAVRADSFIALAGGIGTLDEISEAIALKQLHYHNKPVVFVNTNRFYHDLFIFFDRMIKEEFAYPGFEDLYHVADDAAGAYRYIDQYRVGKIPSNI